jgi:hypothetical protein
MDWQRWSDLTSVLSIGAAMAAATFAFKGARMEQPERDRFGRANSTGEYEWEMMNSAYQGTRKSRLAAYLAAAAAALQAVSLALSRTV